ncbi:nucleoside triphosphate pyrophosphohydrolase [Natranaerofaba carboxydovora]|uniref:nucleoside triphosphate pyrophosphohydrolase n=1 Tax=Natranaerofaba carboxydovora TaxID=2742683 RepID=UPI001F12910E|nr:nucleoside triphosphate pyrophosphohydrolase [Natranaerofaba carboxydovora]UMZ75277.1 Nucleoside triphosphate pyrophosphohydrolase/pyrophosphatase MazG [Natranaerofaba carboxydovora]
MEINFEEIWLIYCQNPLEDCLTLKHYEILKEKESIISCTPGIDKNFFAEESLEITQVDSKESLNKVLKNYKGSKFIFLINEKDKLFLDMYLISLIRNKDVLIKKEKLYDLQNESNLLTLMDIMRVLRGDNGCPWDKKQSHESLKPYVIEEAYEVVEAVDRNSMENLCEELGDLLLQVVFHAALAEEKEEFYISDVIQGIEEKMIRRHPHVFGDVNIESVSQVNENWDKIKQKEKKEANNKSKILKDPKHLPGLLRAEKIQSQAKDVGFDWESKEGALEKMKEELKELENAYKGNIREKIEEELGDLLFSVVNVARFMNVSPELSLQKTIEKFYRRFSYIEENIKKQNLKFDECELEDLDKLWEKAKKSGF